MRIDPLVYGTQRVYRYTANTAGAAIDFADADGLGPADAVIVNVIGDDRTATFDAGGVSGAYSVQDGRSPAFNLRAEGVTISSGTSATIEVIALYADRWTAAA